jgi:hypothetical protein
VGIYQYAAKYVFSKALSYRASSKILENVVSRKEPFNILGVIENVNAYSHNTANFQNPFTYDPSRFLGKPEYSTDRLDAVQPFSVGPRSCIGKK